MAVRNGATYKHAERVQKYAMALTSDRPYRRALDHETAIAMIHERRGSMFAPRMTDACLQIVARLQPAPTMVRPVVRPALTRGPWPIEASAR